MSRKNDMSSVSMDLGPLTTAENVSSFPCPEPRLLKRSVSGSERSSGDFYRTCLYLVLVITIMSRLTPS
jgi:hypothetical protein